MNKALIPELSIQSFTESSRPVWDIPGMSAAVIKDGQVVFNQGFGVTNLTNPGTVNENTIFAIGSNTKAFTATAIGLLVAEGKLNWEDRVTRYLPHFAMYDEVATQEMTIRDLMCHRGGLGTWSGDIISYGSSYSREEVVQRIRYIPPAYPFRAGYGYCNLLFLTAGQIIPQVTGQSWDEFIVNRLFNPLGMQRSFPGLDYLKGQTNIASPHERLGDAIHPVAHRDTGNHGPAGSIYSTSADMIHWVEMQLNYGKYAGQQIAPKDIIDETRQPNTPIRLDPFIRSHIPSRHFSAYGLGWFLMDYRGRQVIYHTGGVDGMVSLVAMVPEENLGMVLLTNKMPHSFHNAFLMHTLDELMGIPPTDWNRLFMERDLELERKEQQKKQERYQSRTGKQLSQSMAAYSGTYQCQIYGSAEITLEEGGLSVRLSAHPSMTGRLEHWDAETFICSWSDPVLDQSFIPFTLDEHGKPASFKAQFRPDWIDPLEYTFTRS